MTATTGTIRVWAEMIKFSHSVFALPFAVIATFLAGREIEGVHHPRLGQFALIVAAMVSARSVAMTFNRIADARIDAENPRTAGRPLPAGVISRRAAWFFLAVAAVAFLLTCAAFKFWYANPWPLYLGVPVLLYLCGYSYTKRFTRWSHFWLGSAIGLSPVAAWIAIDPASLGWPAVILSGTVTLWIAGFDVIYACQDVDFDRDAGLHSLPARIGPKRALWLARLCHLLVVVLLTSLAFLAPLGWLYLIGVGAVAVLLAVENSLVSADDLSRVNLAFFTINGIVSLGLGVLAVLDILLLTPAA